MTRVTRIQKRWRGRLLSLLVVLVTAALVVLAISALHGPRTAPPAPSTQQRQAVAL